MNPQTIWFGYRSLPTSHRLAKCWYHHQWMLVVCSWWIGGGKVVGVTLEVIDILVLGEIDKLVGARWCIDLGVMGSRLNFQY